MLIKQTLEILEKDGFPAFLYFHSDNGATYKVSPEGRLVTVKSKPEKFKLATWLGKIQIILDETTAHKFSLSAR